MKDAKQVDALGYAALIARTALVNMTGVEGPAVLVAQCEHQLRELLAESGLDPSLAERMATVRAMHIWLTAHAFASIAATNAGPNGRGAGPAANAAPSAPRQRDAVIGDRSLSTAQNPAARAADSEQSADRT